MALKINDYIILNTDELEHLLNCLDHQKYLPVPDTSIVRQIMTPESEAQAIIDNTNREYRKLLFSKVV